MTWKTNYTEKLLFKNFSNIYYGACSVTQLCLTLCDPWTKALWALLSMEFFRQEYYCRLPFPSPGDLSSPGIKLKSPVASALADRLFTTEPPEKSHIRESISLLDFPGGTVVKNLPANAGDARGVSLILNWGRCPDGANDNPFQYSCLENSMDKEPGELQSMEWQRVRHNEGRTCVNIIYFAQNSFSSQMYLINIPYYTCIKIICPFTSGHRDRTAHSYIQTEYSSQDEKLFTVQVN